MIRLLHTADIHLGAKFIDLGEKGTIQREQIRATFKTLISRAIEKQVDIVLIAGDLFDSNQQPRSNVDLVIEQFGLLASKGTAVCLIPGTHDCLDSGSIYKKINFAEACPNLTLFIGDGWNYKEFPSLRLTVYGKPNTSNRSHKSPLDGLKRLTESTYHVAMAHGSLDIGTVANDDHLFTTQQIQTSQMNYIALGHWHDSYPCSKKGVIAWYSGAPEMISMDQKEPGGVLLVTILDSGEVKVEPPIQTGLRCCDTLEINVSDLRTLPQLKTQIMQGATPNLVRRVVLKGLRGEELHISQEELESELAANFFCLRIKDQSHPKVAQFPEGAFEDQLILAKFVSLMKEHINISDDEDKEIAEEALQYGLALLQGKEIL